MKKSLVLLLAVLMIFAITIELPDSGITGFFVKVGITGMSIAREIVKSVLTIFLKLLG
jgi:hypothetical protein